MAGQETVGDATEAIYARPEDYDLELAGQDVRDLSFWLELVRRERPRRVLELGCGTGRLTLPLARRGAREGFRVTGLEPVAPMLARAREHAAGEPDAVRAALDFVEGDARSLELGETFDLILLPFGAAHHLSTIEDQLAAWRGARRHLAPGGLFVVDVCAPDFGLLAEARAGTPRHDDLAAADEEGRTLRRTVAVSYAAAAQRAIFGFEYEVRDPDGTERAYASPFAMQVYYPRELELLFATTGFRLESLRGSYADEPYGDGSPLMIALGRAIAEPDEAAEQPIADATR